MLKLTKTNLQPKLCTHAVNELRCIQLLIILVMKVVQLKNKTQ